MDKISESHWLLEEIFQQPNTVLKILKTHINHKKIVIDTFGTKAPIFFGHIHRVQIITTHKNYHVGLMARYWLEEISGVPCQIEVAVAYLSRMKVIESNKLCVILSDTGEEPETIKALSAAKDLGYIAILSICNAARSTVVHEADLVLMTGSARDIGLAETQTFTAQLTGFFLLAIPLGRYHRLDEHREKILVNKLETLPDILHQILLLNTELKQHGQELSERQQAIYLGRDIQLPIAMEGAYKLNELSTIHASAHSPEEFQAHPLKSIESINFNLPIVALAPSYDFFDKWKASFKEFRKHQYAVFAFTDKKIVANDPTEIKIVTMPSIDRLFSPIIYTLPMQLLACHISMLRMLS